MTTPNASVHTLDAIGIDIGFFQTKYTYGRDDLGHILLDKFPSRAARQPSLTDWGSKTDRPDGVVLDVDGVAYFVGPAVMDVLNDRASRQVNDGFVKRPEYKAFLRGVFYRVASHYCARDTLEIEHLVMGQPVTSLTANRSFLRQLALGEHWVPRADGTGVVRVLVRNVYIVAQPQGAVAAVQDDDSSSATPAPAPQTCLVNDMGGGTYDWLVCTGMRLHQGRAGSVDKGTLACVEAALKVIRPDLVRDIPANLIMDRALRSEAAEVELAGKSYKKDLYWPAVQVVLQDATEEMLSSVQSWGDVNRVIVTGGGGSLLAEALKARMPERADMISLVKDPVMANVRGFHLLAETQAELCQAAEAK